MKLFYDTRLGYLVSAPGQDSALSGFNVKAGDTEEIVLQFGKSSDPTAASSIVEAPTWTPENRGAGTVITIALKELALYSDGPTLATSSSYIHDTAEKTYTFSLPLNTTAINTALGRVNADDADDVADLDAGFEVTFQEGGSGGWRSSVEPCPVTIYHDKISGTEGAPNLADDPSQYLLRQDGIIYLPTVNRLTGGTVTDLDAIVTTALSGSANYAYALTDEDATPDTFRIYRLEAGTDAESAPDVIRPDDYDGSTNAKIWRLLKNSTGISAVLDDTSPQLGGDLDTNGSEILFDDAKGIKDASGNELIIFQSQSSAVNHFEVYNSSAGAPVSIHAAGTGNVDIDFWPLGSGVLKVKGIAVPMTSGSGSPVPSATSSARQSDFSFGLSDIGTLVSMRGDLAAVVGTIPLQSSVAWTAGAYFWVWCTDATNTVSLATGGTLFPAVSSMTAGKIHLIYRQASDYWVVLSSN